jgi:hypothetical protein
MAADGRIVFFRDQAAVRLAMVSLMTTPQLLEEAGGFRPAWFGADLEMVEALRRRYGEEALPVVRAPQIFALMTETSLTRRPGSEAREDGYRSPARRVYLDLVRRRASDEEITAWLRESGNLAPAAPIDVISPA